MAIQLQISRKVKFRPIQFALAYVELKNQSINDNNRSYYSFRLKTISFQFMGSIDPFCFLFVVFVQTELMLIKISSRLLTSNHCFANEINPSESLVRQQTVQVSFRGTSHNANSSQTLNNFFLLCFHNNVPILVECSHLAKQSFCPPNCMSCFGSFNVFYECSQCLITVFLDFQACYSHHPFFSNLGEYTKTGFSLTLLLQLPVIPAFLCGSFKLLNLVCFFLELWFQFDY